MPADARYRDGSMNTEVSTVPPSVLLVGIDANVSGALAMVLQRTGAQVAMARTAGNARLILAAAPSIRAVVCRCSEPADDGQSLPAWLGTHHPSVGIIALCNTPGDAHADLPEWCQLLESPYDAGDIARALADARLDAFANAPD
jgi:DNA-binding NtrC family response regulator